MSFLDKLKVKIEEGEQQQKAEKTDDNRDKMKAGFLQLDVDIYQTPQDIIIVAPIPGVEVNDLDISIENENDVVTIQGKRNFPDLDEDNEDRKFLRQENQWGQFYRQIILPQEINVSEVEAKFRKGILILKLPLLRLQNDGRKRIVVDSE